MKITFLIAPGIPNLERKQLKKHWVASQTEKDYMLVTNYEVQVVTVDYKPNKETLLMIAPQIPSEETFKLSKRVRKALKRKFPVVAVNYELTVDTVPR